MRELLLRKEWPGSISIHIFARNTHVQNRMSANNAFAHVILSGISRALTAKNMLVHWRVYPSALSG